MSKAGSPAASSVQPIVPTAQAQILVLSREVAWKDGQILALTQQVINLTEKLEAATEEAAQLRGQLMKPAGNK